MKTKNLRSKFVILWVYLVSSACRISTGENSNQDPSNNNIDYSKAIADLSCKTQEGIEIPLRISSMESPLNDCGLVFNKSKKTLNVEVQNKSERDLVLETFMNHESTPPNFKIDSNSPMMVPALSKVTVVVRYLETLQKAQEESMVFAFSIPNSQSPQIKNYARIKLSWSPQVNSDESGSKPELLNPKVTGIRVKGTQWKPNFIKLIDLENPNEETKGYLIPFGKKQLAPLSWVNLDQIMVTFSSDVGDSLDLEDFQLSLDKGLVPESPGSTNLRPSQDVKIKSFTYHRESKMVQLFLDNVIETSVVNLSIKSKGVFDKDGLELFGKWKNAQSFISGEDKKVNDFQFQFRVLGGDVNQDYSVDKIDQDLVLPTLFGGISPDYTIFKDATGTGAVSLVTRPEVRNRANSKLITSNPIITAIRVGSDEWHNEFKNHIDPSNANTDVQGYIIPTGVNQLNPLSWHNVNQISVTFSSDIGDSLELSDFSLIQQLGTRGTQKASPSKINNFKYDPASKTATLFLDRHIETSRLSLTINSEDVLDSSGRQLMGEWIDGKSSKSGENFLLDDFKFSFNFLPGDTNQDLEVNQTDRDLVIANQVLGVSPTYTIFKDLDGNRFVSILERQALYPLLGSKLP